MCWCKELATGHNDGEDDDDNNDDDKAGWSILQERWGL